MKLPCCIVKDLLPLFIEDIDSEKSHCLIEEHLKDCNECKTEADNLRRNTVDVIPEKDSIGAFRAVQQKLARNKTTIITAFLLMGIILMMFSSWFGGARGVQEIKGTIVLLNPITLVCVLSVVISLFFKKEKANNILRVCGFSGIVLMEIFYYLTWYLETINPAFKFSTSFNMAYPEFYLGLIISCIPLVLSIFQLFKKGREQK